MRSVQEAGPADEEAQCGGSLYETSVMAGAIKSTLIMCAMIKYLHYKFQIIVMVMIIK